MARKLKRLENDKSIVIKEADKGGAAVMTYTYVKVDPSCDNKAMIANNALTKKHENSFLKHEIDYQLDN